MPWAQSLPTREEQQAVLSEGNAAFGAGTEFQFIYRETATNAVVGGGGLHRRVGPGAIEIGYWVRSDRHNRGYATTAARAMTDAAFVFLDDIDRVEIHMDAANSPSARVPEKLGYQLIRTETREKLTPANTDTTMVWQTTRSAWQELKELS